MRSRACFAALLFASLLPAQTVRFRTNMGDIDVNLLPNDAPLTVQNFLNYMNRGAYNNSFFHRSVPGFVIQGGGYTSVGGAISDIAEDRPVVNEYKVPNARYTIAMAKLGNNPNSATSQWFFNVADNTSVLGPQNNGGFTVFGRVANTASQAVVDAIARLRVYRFADPFGELPLRNYTSGTPTEANLVLVQSISLLEPTPAIAQNGVISASSFGGFPTAAPGSFLEIYGTNLAGTTRGWTTSDFTDGRAPTSLEGVSVTVNGEPAFVNFVSPTQINVQAPANLPTGGTVEVIVKNGNQSSAAAHIAILPRVGGLLAPASFRVDGRQYVAAVHSSTGALVSNGRVPGVPEAPATPGEILTFFGVGFGPVAGGAPIAGQVATGTADLTVPVEFTIGDTPAQVLYAGLAPQLVGVYQFNAVVPPGLAAGDHPVRVMAGGEAVQQTLFLPVR